jgi:hypothetical protein
MRATVYGLCAVVLLLGGCRRAIHSVADMAENTRTATEKLVTTSNAANAQKEIEINPDAGILRNAPPVQLSRRYETREGPDGFMIYDTQDHTIARIGNQTQAGLTLDQAKKAADALSGADAKGRGGH